MQWQRLCSMLLTHNLPSGRLLKQIPYHGSHIFGLTNFPREYREFWTDWKSQGILPKILDKRGNFTQNTGKVRNFSYFIYFIFFADFLIEVCLLNEFLYLVNSLKVTLKKFWKMEKILEKSDWKMFSHFFQSMWEPCHTP